jgi:uncharacterized membrane protein YeaQ/YmgE (transglycosylase-associated protein family)
MEEKLSWTNQHTLWLLLGVIFGLIAYFIVTPTKAGFSTGIIYALSAITIGEMLYIRAAAEGKHQPNIWAMIIGAIVGSMPVIISLTTFDSNAALWISVIGIIGVYFLNEQDGFGIDFLGTRDPQAGLLAVVPMFIWVLFSLVWLQNNMNALLWQNIIYHVGLLLFAGYSALRFLGIGVAENEKTQKYAAYLLALAVLGALLTLNTLGGTLAFT